jgi:acyl carrier protein
MNDLEREITVLIIDTLNLESVAPSEIDPSEDLFGNEGLGLDSIDALELGVAIQRKYGIKLEADDKAMKAHFRSVTSLVQMIERHS